MLIVPKREAFGMEMMDCPHCGVKNSVKRDHCFQCNGELRGGPNITSDLEYIPTCADCSRSAVQAPPGGILNPEEVWCLDRDEPVPSAQIAGDCFQPPFGWRREDILD